MPEIITSNFGHGPFGSRKFLGEKSFKLIGFDKGMENSPLVHGTERFSVLESIGDPIHLFLRRKMSRFNGQCIAVALGHFFDDLRQIPVLWYISCHIILCIHSAASMQEAGIPGRILPM